MKNNKKLIAIVVAIVIALVGLIAFILHDSGDSSSKGANNGQLVNFQGLSSKKRKMVSWYGPYQQRKLSMTHVQNRLYSLI